MDLQQLVWTNILAAHWVFAGVANAMILIVIGRILIFGYREHSYLYQFDDRSRAFDTWIKVLLPVARLVPLPRYRTGIALRLARAGTRRDWEADHFIASQILYAGVAFIASYLLCFMLLGLSLVWVVAISAFSLFLPYLKLSDVAAHRFKSCQRDLPYFIDYLALAMGAGLDFNHALTTVVTDAPESPLRDEFTLVLRNIKLGMSRADALLEMERRLASPSYDVVRDASGHDYFAGTYGFNIRDVRLRKVLWD